MSGSKRRDDSVDNSDNDVSIIAKKIETQVSPDFPGKRKEKMRNVQNVSITFTTKVADRSHQVPRIDANFNLNTEQANAVFDLARDLDPEDPAILITFREAALVRAGLQLGGADGVANRPCDPGPDDATALQNMKDWVIGLLPAAPTTVTSVGENGLALANLTHNQCSTIALALSFTPQPILSLWAHALLQSGSGIGKLYPWWDVGLKLLLSVSCLPTSFLGRDRPWSATRNGNDWNELLTGQFTDTCIMFSFDT
jgi:hypothetical protein